MGCAWGSIPPTTTEMSPWCEFKFMLKREASLRRYLYLGGGAEIEKGLTERAKSARDGR